MITFKSFFESRGEGLIPSDPSMSFEDFMKTLEGSTISELLDKGSYVRMYMGNKYGFSNLEDKDKDIQNFTDALGSFVNKDILKHRPTERAYESPEFRDKHNYKEYEDLNNERRAIFRELIGKSSEERKEIEQRKRALEERITNTQFYKAMKAVDAEYDEAVKNYHRTPLSSRELSDDGSPEYTKLERAYNKLMGKEIPALDSTVIDI